VEEDGHVPEPGADRRGGRSAAGPILLVEDSEDDVVLTRRAFARSGFDNPLVAVADGEQCLAALLPQPGGDALRPALVLLDLNLPRIGGLEVLGRLRADPRTRPVPVVILTTSRDRRDILDGYLLGANGYVCKPVSYSRFLDLARALGTYWLTVNEPCPAPGAPP
jgi:two-component system response regulator